MRSMVWLVRACAAYNLAGGATLVTPGALELLGVASPGSVFWLWLPALLGAFGAIVLILALFDLGLYGAFVYWNAIVRLVFAVVSFTLVGDSVGPFGLYLALGDALLGLAVCLPRAINRSPLSLVLNRPATVTAS